MLYSIVYTSQATAPVDSGSLLQLLDAARAANSTLDVTGLLLYKDGAFMQALEGEEATVSRLAEKISRDKRHRGYFVCSRKAIDKRQFGEWSMGFRNLDDHASLTDMPGYSDFMNQPLTRETIERNPSIVSKLLLAFRN